MGKLYKTLNNIEMARQNAVRNAKAAGLPASDDMSLNGLSELYRLQNNEEDIEVEEIEHQLWEEPSDWIDIKTILENEPHITYNDNDYTPLFIILLSDEGDVYNDIANTEIASANYNIVLKTSDEQIIRNTSISKSQPIIWDTTKDIPCSLGYNMRYIIYYMETKELTQRIQNNSVGHAWVFYNKPILKIVYGNIPFSSIGNFYSSSDENNYICVLDCLENTIFNAVPNRNNSGGIYDINNLRRVTLRLEPSTSYGQTYGIIGSSSCIEELNLYGLTHLTNSQGNINNAHYLRNVSLPDLETAITIITDCNNVSSISLPKLKKSTGKLFSSLHGLKKIELPVIEEASTICYQCSNIRSIILPTLRKVTETYGQIVYDCNSLETLSLPSLETIEATGTSHSSNYGIIQSCDNLKYVQFPSLQNINIPSCIVGFNGEFTLDLPIVSDISAAYLMYGSNASGSLRINAPQLQSITIDDLLPSISSYVPSIYITHNNPIDITLNTNYQQISSWTRVFARMFDDNINHITFKRELTLPTLQAYLTNSKYKKVTCKIANGPTFTNKDKPIYLNNDNVLCRDGVELDLLDGSNMSTHTTLNHRNLVKLLTNLIALPDGETRTLTLGEVLLAKLTAGEIAIATNKGWVLE